VDVSVSEIMKAYFKFLMLAVASAFLLTGCCTSHRVTAWEYTTVRSIDAVNALAKEGWSVAGFTEYQNSGNPITQVFVMKRPRQ
jgi:hypothetical protein